METATAVIPAAMKATSQKFTYSPGVLAGNLLFVAGQVGRDADGNVITDPEQQFITAFKNLGSILEEADAGFSDVVDLTTYHTTLENFPLFAEVKSTFFTAQPYPA